MKLKKQSSPQETDANSRFLIKHSSSSFLNIFGCCSSSTSHNYETPHPQKATNHKISIKNVLKKSAMFGNDGSPSISDSRYYKGEQKEQAVSPSSFKQIRKSQLSQVSGRLMKAQSQRTIEREGRKINFVYNQQQGEKVIHNYHTTNYIVQKYIVKPQQMNLFVNNHQPTPRDHQLVQKNPKNQQKNQAFKHQHIPLQRHAKNEESSNNIHYSFGAAQKKALINQFSGFRQVSSNRPSKQAAKIQNQQQAQIREQENNLSAYSSMGRKPSLNNLVRAVSIMDDEQFDDMSSDASQVIQSYQNFMSRVHQKGDISYRFDNTTN